MTAVPDPLLVTLMERAQSLQQMTDRWLRRRLGDPADRVTPALFSVLILLKEEGPQKMGDLARRARMAPRSMTTLVDRLEREGLAVRQPHPTDRRATIIELTTAGVAAVDGKATPYWTAKSLLFDALRPGEPEMLLSVYERWLDLISEDLRRMEDAA